MDIKNLRIDYNQRKIDFNHFPKDPISLFINWFNEALKSEQEANSCVLSTVDIKNIPSSRVVLLKDVNNNGFIFFTNYNSSKAKDIEKNKHVALNFHWGKLERQVRITGVAEKISERDSDEYFKSRPLGSQLATLISEQSNSIDMAHDYMKKLENAKKQYKNKNIQRPMNWGGYIVEPNKIEFWQGRPSRLHDRLVYFNKNEWVCERLAP